MSDDLPLRDDPPTHQRILGALAELQPDRPEVVADFARATLRRLPDVLLRRADPTAAARRLLDAFATLDRRRGDEVAIDVLRPPTGLDGRTPAPTVIEVACEDRPFLLSTVIDELERMGYRVLRSLHPIVGVERGDDGRIAAIVPARTAATRDSLLHLEIEGAIPSDEDERIRTRLLELIADVWTTTDDHPQMRERVQQVADELRGGAWPGIEAAEAEEVAALLDWLLDQNLILLGLREYRFLDLDGRRAIEVVRGSGLGLLGDESGSRFTRAMPLDELPDELRPRVDDPPLLTVTRTRRLSTVHRRVRMEYLGLVRRDDEGRPEREIRIVGLFTRKALTEPSGTTPVLREKLRQVLEREDVVPGSHDEVVLRSLFQALPKDELFQADTDQLHRTLVGLLHAEEHRDIRTLARVDDRTRTVSVLIAVPRDTYSPQLRSRLQEALRVRYNAGRVDVEVSLGDRNEALARFLLHVDGPVPDVPLSALQAEIRALARSWLDDLRGLLEQRVGDDAERLTADLGRRLPRSYRDTVSPERAVTDVLLLSAALAADDPLLVALHRDPDPRDGTVRLRAAKRGEPLELSSFLPILESLGLTVIEEVPYRLEGDDPPAHLHDFGVRAEHIDVDRIGPRLADAVLAAWRGHLEVDSLNRLVLSAELGWRDIALLRAYRRLRRQVGTTYTPEYTNDVLVANPQVVRALIEHLHARFDPALADDEAARESARRNVIAACDDLARLDHDRILRGLLHLVDATLRTNAFRSDAVADASGEPYVAIKLDPSLIPGVPSPVPHREIFVHSPRVEGVHLRGGPVARGGLRWSDRRDDVRTEVLDLVKAQILKNALIVPTGAKGGFVLSQEPDDPTALRDEVRRQYVTFVRGLLDVTDDLAGDRVVHPPDVVRHDGDDPYLVVAADRGTAALSDTANEIARRYGFWLDDGFASGGSQGYDHKELGVTARGAWVAVQQHFRELGVDVQTEPITIVGVGDMSGDVFGNGLLRSSAVKLVAAFDHRHVFVDPDPDPSRSFAERQRLFDLPRSSWDDYDRTLLSEGGGIFPRSARRIELSEQIRSLLRIEVTELSPPELIRAILVAPVDLLFAGGIGTYVKSSAERNEDVGDRATDELRVDANRVRARVIGEGANLFITQRGRLEYARRGGLVNQDAIDNAAGVSTSDHEVNVKILLTLAEEEGRIDRGERDRILTEVADDVVALVLRDVGLQAAALSREVSRSPGRLDAYEQFMSRLERDGDLDRAAEVLPSTEELVERADAGAGLNRPELATLLAWAKRDLKEALLASDVVDGPLLRPALATYFPEALVSRFGDLLDRHRLRRELIATVTANDVVDRMGITFVSSLAEETRASLPEVVVAERLARALTLAFRWWQHLDAVSHEHQPERVRELEAPLIGLIGDVATTLLTENTPADPGALLARDGKVAARLLDGMLELGTPDQRRARVAHARWLVDDLVDPELARLLACARDLTVIPDVAGVLADLTEERAPTDVADAFLRLGEALGVDRLVEQLGRIEARGGWPARQRRGLAADLRRLRRDAVRAALRDAPDHDELGAVERFLEVRERAIGRAHVVAEEVANSSAPTLDAVAVATRAIRDVVERGG